MFNGGIQESGTARLLRRHLGNAHQFLLPLEAKSAERFVDFRNQKADKELGATLASLVNHAAATIGCDVAMVLSLDPEAGLTPKAASEAQVWCDGLPLNRVYNLQVRNQGA